MVIDKTDGVMGRHTCPIKGSFSWTTINEILTKNQIKNKFPHIFQDNGSTI